MGQTRSVCLVGHSGSGKTALAKALLNKGESAPEVAFDESPEERRRGYSVDLAIGSCRCRETQLSILVTPGLGEFAEEIYKGVVAADLAVLVVNAEKPVEVVTEQSWTILEGLNRPTMVFVNMMDRPDVDPDGVLDQLRQQLGNSLWPLQLPVGTGPDLKGVVGLTGPNGKAPDELQSRLEQAKAALLEEVATLDDALVEKVLADEQISDQELTNALRKGVASRGIVPVLWGSAESGVGVSELLEHVLHLAPEREYPQEPRLLVFSMTMDPYLGKLAFARVLGQEVGEGASLVNLRTGGKVQVRDILGYKGTKLERVGTAGPGEIVALSKLEGVQLGDTLGASAESEPEVEIPFPKPVFSRSVAPKAQADEEKMSTVLRDLVTTKVTLNFRRDPVTKEAILSGMGDLQLDVLAERIHNRYGVDLEYHVPKIPYRETIRKEASAQYRHKKQTGGRGQFGEVHLRIKPLPRGEGFVFADETKGGVIPQQFIPGVEKGVREALEAGIVVGYPVEDVRAAVFYGQFHPVDSSEMAFKIAARSAFKLAAENAGPSLLEPVMLVTVFTPEAHTGDIISDLNSRRGRILGMESESGRTEVKAEVPLVEVQSYALDLKSMTQGRATYQMEFLRYDYVPSQIQEKVVAEASAADDAN
ncbi:MAG: elongation factor G [Candidatus Bipolaricaulota bacterium]